MKFSSHRIIPAKYSKDAQIVLYGDMFNYTKGNGVYLSGGTTGSQYVDLYSDETSLSSTYTPFSGMPISYVTVNNNEINFKLPENLSVGDYVVIFCNPAGYTISSNNNKNYIIRIV